MDCTHRSAPHRRHCDTVLYCIKPHTFLRKPILTPGSDPSVVLDPTLTIFYAIASVVSTIALVLKVKVFIQQLRERHSELSALDEDVQTERSRKLQTHKKRLVQTTRSIYMTYTSMMVGVAECVPLGILQGASNKHCAFVHLLLMCSYVLTVILQRHDCKSLDWAGLDELVLVQFLFCCVCPKRM